MMTVQNPIQVATYTAFAGGLMLAAGAGEQVAEASAAQARAGAQVLIFDDHTGRQVELDLRNPSPTLSGAAGAPGERPGRGRPRLGVVAREVTLLPRHWEWLAIQPGGASAALRRLVDDARRANAGPDEARRAQQALYSVMSALAGDLPGFEEAARALYAKDDARFDSLVAPWPRDIRDYVARLAAAERNARTA